MSIRDHFLATRPLRRDTVKIDGQPVTVQELDGDTWGIFQEELTARQNGANRPSVKYMNALFVVLCVVDADTNQRVFTLDDLDALQKQPSRILLPVARAVQAISEIQENDFVETAKND